MLDHRASDVDLGRQNTGHARERGEHRALRVNRDHARDREDRHHGAETYSAVVASGDVIGAG
jgi:hypothetical protein